MKNIDFENNEIKKEYKNLLKEENFLLNILYSLECEYQTIVIIDIIKEDDMTKIITKCDNTVININIDYEKNQTIYSAGSDEYIRCDAGNADFRASDE